MAIRRGLLMNAAPAPETPRLMHTTMNTGDVQAFALTADNYRADLVRQAGLMDRHPLAGYKIDICENDRSNVLFAIVHQATGAVVTDNVAAYDRQERILTLRSTIETEIQAGERALIAYLAQHVAISLLLPTFPELAAEEFA
jgi:hypothetical protein